MWDQFFDGYCPESKLKGEKIKMRLNSHDFFESEKTGLQVAISYPGVHAVVLKFRGKGDFRKTVTYADEVANGELLSPQLVDRFPYCGDEVFRNENEFSDYFGNEVEIRKTDITDFEALINRFISSSSNEDIAFHRYASFDYCYGYFKSTDISIDIEKSCLVLGFYLASWGMLRGSGFLLQKSCKHFEELIYYISDQQKKQGNIWDIDVDTYPENYDLLVQIYKDIKKKVVLDGKSDLTLVTKIMLGVYGFVPAFDSFFVQTFNRLFKGKISFNQFNNKRVNFNMQPLGAIYDFYTQHKEGIDKISAKTYVLDFKTGKKGDLNYPKAKIIDMYGFQIGIESA